MVCQIGECQAIAPLFVRTYISLSTLKTGRRDPENRTVTCGAAGGVCTVQHSPPRHCLCLLLRLHLPIPPTPTPIKPRSASVLRSVDKRLGGLAKSLVRDLCNYKAQAIAKLTGYAHIVFVFPYHHCCGVQPLQDFPCTVNFASMPSETALRVSTDNARRKLCCLCGPAVSGGRFVIPEEAPPADPEPESAVAEAAAKAGAAAGTTAGA